MPRYKKENMREIMCIIIDIAGHCNDRFSVKEEEETPVWRFKVRNLKILINVESTCDTNSIWCTLKYHDWNIDMAEKDWYTCEGRRPTKISIALHCKKSLHGF